MATRYDEIIKLRAGKAAYNIAEEKEGEWESFIPNKQFDYVLKTVLKSVRGNDIDNHKSFWVNGTYGTGKSHAVAVLSHLLGDPVENIQEWVDYEYKSDDVTRQAIYSLRDKKRLLTVKLSGIEKMSHAADLALVLQKAVTNTLRAKGIELPNPVPTDYENYIEHIEKNPKIWEPLIEGDSRLSSIVANSKQLIDNLAKCDLATYHRVADTLRSVDLDIRLKNETIKQWLVEVQNELAQMGTYNGLLIVWDEFTDVMDLIGVPVLKELQDIAEKFMNSENNSYLFFISHPSAFNNIDAEQLKQTDGRYHRMKYNMEPVSAFQIMSRKFEVIDSEKHEQMYRMFYESHPEMLDIYIQKSNDNQSTKEDLFNLFPLHPGTATLATHYATVVGSSSRSVFEFLGQNDAIKEFLDSEDHFLNRDLITSDYLWDYVLKVFQDDVTSYGAVTERYNSYINQVGNQGAPYMAVFKGILLLNAFNNISGENNNGLITPSKTNIRNLFVGTQYENDVDQVLQWIHEQGIIQCAPGEMYSVQFSAFPSGEVEEKKNEMRNVQFRYTSQILNFSDAASVAFKQRFMQRVIRPFGFKFYSNIDNEASLRSQIKNGRKEAKGSNLFFALLLARNNEELAMLRSFAERCALDQDDKDLANIVFIVFDEVFTDQKYEQFIEFQAHYACASSHGFVDQTKVHRDHAIAMIKEWMDSVQRNNAIVYINGVDKQSISVKHLSSIVNSSIAPIIFPYGPDAHEDLRQKAPNPFWRAQNSKEIVRIFLFAQSRSEFANISHDKRPVQYLLQDCLDENLEWKSDAPEGHPFKVVCDKINSIIKHADKSLPFNFDEKFSLLAKPPYGLYGNYAAMGMVAFALRPWVNKIFDTQGKPRDAKALVDDISMLFKVWDENKSNSKLTFKFQTPEEGKLCKELINLFNLSGKDSAYKDVSSLKDARYAITGDFLVRKGAPLWSIKYAPKSAFAALPAEIPITDEIKTLVDDIVTICADRDLRNPALVNETLKLLEAWRIDLKNILNIDAVFQEGFNSFLMQIDRIELKPEEIEDVKTYVKGHLESTVGYWTEEEITNAAKNWRLEQQYPAFTPGMPSGGNASQNPTPTPAPATTPSGFSSYQIVEEKRAKAKIRISELTSLDEAKALLMSLCEEGDEWILDKLNK